MARYRTFKKRSYNRRRSQRGGINGGSHLGDSAKGFLDGVSRDLADDVSEKVTNNIFAKLGQMFSQASTTPPAAEEPSPEMMGDESRDDTLFTQEPEPEPEVEQEQELQQEPESPQEPELQQEPESPQEPEPGAAVEPESSQEPEPGAAVEPEPQQEPESGAESPFQQEQIEQAPAVEGEVPVQPGPATNGEGNPIPQNQIRGGRKSHRRQLKYNIRRSHRRYRR